jgi:hypothetical protein
MHLRNLKVEEQVFLNNQHKIKKSFSFCFGLWDAQDANKVLNILTQTKSLLNHEFLL